MHEPIDPCLMKDTEITLSHDLDWVILSSFIDRWFK